jgi:hypothetical protein
MSIRIRGFQVYLQEEIRTRWSYAEALKFLHGLSTDPGAINALRALAARRPGNVPDARAGNDKLLEYLAQMLVAGKLIIAGAPTHASLPQSNGPAAAPRAPEPTRETKSKPLPDEEEPIFNGDLHAHLQAASLRAASESGVPFCEVCERMRKRNAA